MHIPYSRLCRGAAYVFIPLAISACNRSAAQTPPSAQSTASAASNASPAIERGKYLVTIAGCNDCHSPKIFGPTGPQPDPARLLSGHSENDKVATPFAPAAGSPWVYATTADMTAWSGPWGVSFSANLTPDTNTGLHSGVWTEDLFIKTMRTGKHMGTSREILPPMPWPEISKLTDEDLKAVWAYLGTLKPVNNHVADPIPPASGTATR